MTGGRSESEGVVELHVGGDEWVKLAYSWGGFVLADTICRDLGYSFAVGGRQGPPVDPGRRDTLCQYSNCPVGFSRPMDFFDCLDDKRLALCPPDSPAGRPDQATLEVVCATGTAYTTGTFGTSLGHL